MVDVSVCILSFKGKDVVENCLSSVYEYSKDLNKEVIVVDNNSNDGTVEMIKAQFPSVKLIVNDRNMYFTKPFNEMARVAQGKYIMILNQDVQFIEDTLSRLVTYMEQNMDVGGVASKSIYSDGHIEKIPKREYSFNGLVLEYTFAGAIFKQKLAKTAMHQFYNYDFETSREVEVVQDSCFMVRKSAVNPQRLYDETYFLYFTEDDLCKDLRARDWKIYYNADTKVHHTGSYSAKKESKFLIKYIYMKDLLYYSRKHLGKLRTVIILQPLIIMNLAILTFKHTILSKIAK